MHKFESLDPDKALVPPKETPEEFRARILLAAAVKLYEGGRISSHGAARLARIPRSVFLTKLADLGVDTSRETDELGEGAPLA